LGHLARHHPITIKAIIDTPAQMKTGFTNEKKNEFWNNITVTYCPQKSLTMCFSFVISFSLYLKEGRFMWPWLGQRSAYYI
jgi:hypothetical protein